MALLIRIAISNGNKARKRAANFLITRQNGRIVNLWHKQLEIEIQKKGAGRFQNHQRFAKRR